MNIFVDITLQAVNTSAEQDNGDHSNEDKMCDKRSASVNKGINEKLSVQTKLPFKHSKQVYTCSHCLVCICGEATYKKHMEYCSKYKCVERVLQQWVMTLDHLYLPNQC